MVTHSPSTGWRWSRRSRFPPRDDSHRSAAPWSGQKRSPACQFLQMTRRPLSEDILPGFWQGPACALTQHLTDVRLDVHVLEVLVRVGVVQPQGRVQPDGHPHAIADPRQLTHLALPARVGIEGLLRGSRSSLPRWSPGEGLSGARAGDSPRSAYSSAGWRGSCSCSRTRLYRGRRPCSGWSGEDGPGPSGGSSTSPTAHLECEAM